MRMPPQSALAPSSQTSSGVAHTAGVVAAGECGGCPGDVVSASTRVASTAGVVAAAAAAAAAAVVVVVAAAAAAARVPS